MTVADTQVLHITIPGVAVPQGSMRSFGPGRVTHSNPQVRAWRATVAAHVIAEIVRHERQGQGAWPATGPTRLTVMFLFPRPRNHYRTGKFAHLLRKVAPVHMSVGPDLDKLVRAIGDALTDACAVVDDKQIDVIHAAKGWAAEDSGPRVYITLRSERQ